jgi:E3 ubiquitin-protein ligase RNF13
LIPSVFIGSSDAALIAKLFVYSVNPTVRIILTDDEPFDINSYLLPFAIVVGICFLIMLGIVIFKVLI